MSGNCANSCDLEIVHLRHMRHSNRMLSAMLRGTQHTQALADLFLIIVHLSGSLTELLLMKW